MTTYVKCPVCDGWYALSPKGNVWAHKRDGVETWLLSPTRVGRTNRGRGNCPGGSRPPTLPGAVDQGYPTGGAS